MTHTGIARPSTCLLGLRPLLSAAVASPQVPLPYAGVRHLRHFANCRLLRRSRTPTRASHWPQRHWGRPTRNGKSWLSGYRLDEKHFGAIHPFLRRCECHRWNKNTSRVSWDQSGCANFTVYKSNKRTGPANPTSRFRNPCGFHVRGTSLPRRRRRSLAWSGPS